MHWRTGMQIKQDLSFHRFCRYISPGEEMHAGIDQIESQIQLQVNESLG